MLRKALSPKWIIAHLAVAALAATFVFLGMWQLHRLEERRETNRVGAERFSMEPVPFEVLENQDPKAIEYRRVTVTGRPLPGHEVLIRSQVYLGTAGYHLIVPVSHRDATEVLVNRGWVPLGTEPGTVDHGGDDKMNITIEGWVSLTEERPPLGPLDPPSGVLTVMNRVDIDRIREQTNPRVSLANVYIVEVREQGSGPPFSLSPPDFGDEGPHLGYAIQWFGFTAVLVVGYAFLARRRLLTSV